MSAPHVVALSALPAMGPARLAALVDRWPAEEAWARISAGVVAVDEAIATSMRGDARAIGARWQAAAAAIDVDGLWQAHVSAGVHVLVADDLPPALGDDPEPPAVLFVLGDPEALRDHGPRRVAIVGTRRCTWAGRAVARSLGADLGRAGVCVVSGLALGIDGEAHLGALEAPTPPVAVVGTGLDVVYPRRHLALWRRVAAAGAVVSEYPLGTGAERWRFPARNRLIAGLAEVVVVVESAAGGGSMHTVDAALERDRTVLAVPGPVRSPASAGTNGLLAAGLAPCRDADDVLVALGLEHGVGSAARPSAPPDDPPEVALVLDALGWEPTTLDELADRLGSPLGPVAVHLTRLATAGRVVQRAGWWERVR